MPDPEPAFEKNDDDMMFAGEGIFGGYVMDQIANLVIDLSLDAQEFKDEVPRIKKILEDASDKAEISAQRQKILLNSCRNKEERI